MIVIHSQGKFRFPHPPPGLTTVGRRFLLSTLSIGLWLCGCASPTVREPAIPSALDPQGPAAANIEGLWWIMFWLGAAVFVAVTALLLLIVFIHRRQEQLDPDLQAPDHRSWVWWGGAIIPFLILATVLFFTLRSHIALANPPTEPVAVIEVVGWRWWWEVRYPDQQIVTANEIHIPVGEPVLLRLTAGDVIHSFWVPELHGKMDMIPGKTNTLWLQADEPGVYRGICAEFCGMQHAKMHYMVVAQSADDYAAWLEEQRQPAAEPDSAALQQGQQLFFQADCAFCHAISGTAANGRIGPDLTHVASRQTLAAGTLPNNRGSMGGWITNPQHIKPGNLMPPTRLNSEELQLLLDYLASLQ